MKATIYYLKCPIDNKIRYIGRTSCDLKTRLSGHMSNDRLSSTKEKFNWINRLKKKKLRPIILPIEVVDIKHSKDCEIKWLKFFKENNIRLYNTKRFHYEINNQ